MQSRPRRIWVAALFTIFQIGLGHLYSGNFRRGLNLFLIGQFLFLLFAASLIVIEPNALYMIFAVAVGFAFFVFCLVDAILIVHKSKAKYTTVKYNRWFVYLGYILITELFVKMVSFFIVTPFLVQVYMMPTGSMEPTLLVGDHILINKHIYRNKEPKRGAVIVFRSPVDPNLPYVKRVIGVPGDTVEIAGRTVYINEKPLGEAYTKYIDPASINKHYGPYRVPQDQYFVLGDNRDNSRDSRFYGFIPSENLLGKPLIIYWSFKVSPDWYLPKSLSERIEQSVDIVLHFFDKTRWERGFQVIK